MQFKPYQKRSIRFLDVVDYNDWKMKVYSISAKREFIAPGLAEMAKMIVPEMLPDEAFTDQHYGLGFVMLHEGIDGNYIITSWWEGENMLCNHIRAAPADKPYVFRSIADTGIVSCVWELEVHYHEKKAWIQAMLDNESGPDAGKYLSLTYSGNV